MFWRETVQQILLNYDNVLFFMLIMEKQKRKNVFSYAGVAKYCTSEEKGTGQDAEPNGYNTKQLYENREHCSQHLCNRQNPENPDIKEAFEK